MMRTKIEIYRPGSDVMRPCEPHGYTPAKATEYTARIQQGEDPAWMTRSELQDTLARMDAQAAADLRAANDVTKARKGNRR